MNWENLSPNLSLTVEKGWGIHIRKGWSHLKSNIK